MSRHTAKELIPAVGATVSIQMEGLRVRCTVVDAKNAYGKVRLQVTPVAGIGEQWVELTRVVAVDPPAKPEPAARVLSLNRGEGIY